MNGNAQTPQKTKDRTKWPWFAQLFLAVTALATAVVLLIWIPMHAAPALVEESPGGASPYFSTMMAVLVGLATMTISGIFLFMTFRIDRGTREVAQREAKKISRKISMDVANKKTKEVVREIAKKEIKDFKDAWMREMAQGIEDQKRKLKISMGVIQGNLDRKSEDIGNTVARLKLRSEEAEQIVKDLRDEKQNKMDELNEIKNNGVESLQRIRKEGVDRLGELESSIAANLRNVGENASIDLRSVVEDVKTWLKSREKEARQQVEKAEEKAVAEVKKAGDEAKRRIENTIKDVEDDAAAHLDKLVSQAVDEMIEVAHLKIDEADVEKLVDEKVRPFLERSPWARIFGSRPRARRS